MLNFYTREVECKSDIKAFVANIAEIIEVMATENAEKFGYGRDVVMSLGGFWIVSKIRFRIHSYPESNGTLIAETWPLPSGKIKVERQYRIKSGKGDALVNAASEWCVLSIDTRRPLRVEGDCFSGGHEYMNERADFGEFTRIRPNITEQDFCYEREIIDSDIDINNHTNNKKYTEMVLACFTDEYLNENPIKTYELHFVKETVLGNKIRIYKVQNGNTVLITGVTDGATVFNAMLEL